MGHLPLTGWFPYLGLGSPRFLRYQSLPAITRARSGSIRKPPRRPPRPRPNRAANTPGIRHVAFAVEDIDAVAAGLKARGGELVGEVERYQDVYRLCYVRGREGIIVELAQRIG